MTKVAEQREQARQAERQEMLKRIAAEIFLRVEGLLGLAYDKPGKRGMPLADRCSDVVLAEVANVIGTAVMVMGEPAEGGARKLAAGHLVEQAHDLLSVLRGGEANTRTGGHRNVVSMSDWLAQRALRAMRSAASTPEEE